MQIDKLIEKLLQMEEEQKEWKDHLGTTLHIGDTVLTFSIDRYEILFFKGKILGTAATPKRKEMGYVQVQLESKIITCLPKNLLKYYEE